MWRGEHAKLSDVLYIQVAMHIMRDRDFAPAQGPGSSWIGGIGAPSSLPKAVIIDSVLAVAGAGGSGCSEGLQTGDALFAAVSTLEGGPHTLSSYLETLFKAMLYTLSGGVLHGQGTEEEGVRFGAMDATMFERNVLKSIDEGCWPALQRLRAVFFGNGEYHTGVSCQDFLNAL